jgi:hypothetical protein
MFIPSKREQRLGALEERVRRIHAVTPRLLLDVIAGVCVRSAVRNGPAKARIDRLIEAGAFTEATLALIELELPQWQLRRLIYEDGEWLCCLSRQPALPATSAPRPATRFCRWRSWARFCRPCASPRTLPAPPACRRCARRRARYCVARTLPERPVSTIVRDYLTALACFAAIAAVTAAAVSIAIVILKTDIVALLRAAAQPSR